MQFQPTTNPNPKITKHIKPLHPAIQIRINSKQANQQQTTQLQNQTPEANPKSKHIKPN